MKQHFFLMLLILLCTACQAEVALSLPPGLENLKIIPLQPSQPAPMTETLIQVSKNPHATGKFRIMLGSSRGFQTQKTHAQVSFIKLYLVNGNAGTQSPVFISPLIAKTGPNQVFTFSGVDQGSFYVAASAYDNLPSNITNNGGTDYIQVGDGGLQNAFVSSVGGESPTFPGRVTIAPSNHALSGMPTLGINLLLMPG